MNGGQHLIRAVFLFLILTSPTSALSIAASPEVIRFDRSREAALFLYNPSSSEVQYTIESAVVKPLAGTLAAHTSTRVLLKPQLFPHGNTLRITFIPAIGSTHIQIAPTLDLPVELPRHNSSIIFLLVFLLLFISGLILALLLLF